MRHREALKGRNDPHEREFIVKTRMILIAGAAAAVAAAPASALVATPSLTLTQKAATGGGNGGNHDTTKTNRQYCDGGSTAESRWIEYHGPDSIWPPNHKMRDFYVLAHDDDGGTVTLVTTAESSQPANDVGDGNTDIDTMDNTPGGVGTGEGEARTDGQMRAERSGKDKAGRTYTVNSHAVWSDGDTCDKTFTATVPHDQRNQTNTGSKKRSSKRLARR